MVRIIQLLTCFLLPIVVMAQVEVYDTTPLGTKYRIIPAATPEPGSFVYFHASMRTQRDSLMFSTRDSGEPPVIKIAPPDATLETISPAEDVLRFMRVGDRAVVVTDISGFPSKPPGLENDTLVYYDVEVIEVISEDEFNRREAEEEGEKEIDRAQARSRAEEVIKFHKDIRRKYRESTLENVITTESGLKYVIHEMGEGPRPEEGERVSVHYIGSLIPEGEPFDLSFLRGDAIEFSIGVGQVIKGWDEGIMLLPGGTKATLFIPSELGYGADGTPDGSIPPNAEMAYYVEIR